MPTYSEIAEAFLNIANTLGHVQVQGEANLDMVLGSIRYAKNMASVITQAQKAPQSEEEPET